MSSQIKEQEHIIDSAKVQKYVYSSVTTTADRTEETPAEKADTQSKASCYCNRTASVSELVVQRAANVLYIALELLVLILLLARCTVPSTTYSVSQQQLLFTASLRLGGVFLSQTHLNSSKQQTKLRSSELCSTCKSTSAPLNQKQPLNLNQKLHLLSFPM